MEKDKILPEVSVACIDLVDIDTETATNLSDINRMLEYLKLKKMNESDDITVLSQMRDFYKLIEYEVHKSPFEMHKSPLEVHKSSLEVHKSSFEMYKNSEYSEVERIDKIIKNDESIRSLKELENECDLLEINLANLKVEYDEVVHLKKNDLEKEFNALNNDFNDTQFEAKHRNLLNQAYAFLKQEPVNKNILNIFNYIKKERSFVMIVNKYLLLQQIEGCKTLLGQLMNDLIRHTNLSYEYIRTNYNLDNVSVLKLIYKLTNIGIVSYNKEKGVISLLK